MNDVLAIILGGGKGTRLYPLTHQRSKPAVPIGGKYRLIDVPISNCLHADLRRIFVLTQFNSASLNQHIAQSYHMDPFSRGFVEIIAAEQTPDNANWFQGTADAVRQAARHFTRHEADYYLILAGDHLYRMDYRKLIAAHIEQQADITVAALPVGPADASGMGLFLFDRDGGIAGFEEKPEPARLDEIRRTLPPGDKPFVGSMGIYVFTRDVLLDLLRNTPATDFGREIIPAALETHRVRACMHDDYWADVGTVEAFYEANIALTDPDAPFRFYDPRRPIFTHERFLPPSHLRSCEVRESIVADGCFLESCSIERSVIGIRTRIAEGTRITRSVLLGADTYAASDSAPLGIGNNVVLDRVIMDKNSVIGSGARLTNAAGVDHADGPNYVIRSGIIIIPKGARIADDTVI